MPQHETDVSDLVELLKVRANGMALITLRVSPQDEQSKLFRDMSAWMHEAAILMNAAAAQLEKRK